MKKLTCLWMMASLLLISCGGGKNGESDVKGTTIEIKSTKAPLDKFELKETVLVKGGLNNNGSYRPVFYLALADYNGITLNDRFSSPEVPFEKGKNLILFTFYGEYFKKGEEPTKMKVGSYSAKKEEMLSAYSMSDGLYFKDEDDKQFLGNLLVENITHSKGLDGKVEITKITDDLVEGAIELKGEDGTEVKVTFSEKIKKDYWTDNFKNGKL